MNPEENPIPNSQKPDQSAKLQEAILHSKEKEKESAIKPLKTYQSDVAEAIQRDNVSVIKMALAEKRRQERQGVTPEAIEKDSRKKIIFIALSVIFIFAAIGVISFFFLNKNTDNTNTPTFTNTRSLIYAESTAEVKLDNNYQRTLLDSLASHKLEARASATILNLIPTARGIGVINAQDFINIFNTNIPAPLFRSLQNPLMLGLYQDGSSVDTFLILKTDSYENAFAGMLAWEKSLDRDIGPLFNLPDLGPKPFEDRVINNKDTRVLTDQDGKIILIYSFIDSNTLIFSTGERGFGEAVSRFLQAKLEK